LEAQERHKPILLCQKCFSLIPEGGEYCPECGAPTVDDLNEGSDTAVYPELARANLLRMRGEYRQAEEICLAVLRRHPNSATANTLLGDICAEKGDLKQASEWYEMALDITPDSASDRQKLESVRARIKDHEAAQTAKTLGLPESRPKIGLWVGGAVTFIVLVAVVGFLLGERTNARIDSANRNVVAPITLPLDSTRGTGPQLETAPDGGSVKSVVSTDLEGRIRAAAGTDGARVLSVGRMPNAIDVLLVFTVAGGEDARRIGAELGRIALGDVTDAANVTLIAMREGKIAYSGDMSRVKLDETSAEAWKAANGGDPLKFANWVLSDHVPPPASGNPPNESAPPNEAQPPE
jgi:hypothetical protein